MCFARRVTAGGGVDSEFDQSVGPDDDAQCAGSGSTSGQAPPPRGPFRRSRGAGDRLKKSSRQPQLSCKCNDLSTYRSALLVQSRNVPFWRNRNVPSGLSGGVDGGGGIGDERAGARKTYCDRAGVRQGSQPRRGGGAAWDLRSAGQAARSGLSGRGRRRACVAPARAGLDAVLAARQDDSPTAEPARAWITGGLATAPLRARVARPLPTPTQPERRRGHSYCAQSGDISIVR